MLHPLSAFMIILGLTVAGVAVTLVMAKLEKHGRLSTLGSFRLRRS